MGEVTASPQTLVYEVSCKSCHSSSRVEVLGRAAVHPTNKATLYCPCCGADNTMKIYRTGQDDEEYFYILAKAMNFPAGQEGAKVAKAVYNEWDPEEYPRFMDFFRAEFGEEK